jgi:hypothetical protein
MKVVTIEEYNHMVVLVDDDGGIRTPYGWVRAHSGDLRLEDMENPKLMTHVEAAKFWSSPPFRRGVRE